MSQKSEVWGEGLIEMQGDDIGNMLSMGANSLSIVYTHLSYIISYWPSVMGTFSAWGVRRVRLRLPDAACIRFPSPTQPPFSVSLVKIPAHSGETNR